MFILSILSIRIDDIVKYIDIKVFLIKLSNYTATWYTSWYFLANKTSFSREKYLIQKKKDCMVLNYKSQFKHLFVRYQNKHNLKRCS